MENGKRAGGHRVNLQRLDSTFMGGEYLSPVSISEACYTLMKSSRETKVNSFLCGCTDPTIIDCLFCVNAQASSCSCFLWCSSFPAAAPPARMLLAPRLPPSPSVLVNSAVHPHRI